LNFFNWVGRGKNKIRIAIKFCKCYVIKRSPSNFLNKTQLKKLIFLTGSNLVQYIYFWTGPDLAGTVAGIVERKAKRFPLVLTPLLSPPPRYYIPLFISSLPLTIPHADSGFVSCDFYGYGRVILIFNMMIIFLFSVR